MHLFQPTFTHRFSRNADFLNGLGLPLEILSKIYSGNALTLVKL